MTTSLLVTLTGADRPGLAARVFAELAEFRLRIVDVEQVVIRGVLVLGVLVEARPDDIDEVRRNVQHVGRQVGLTISTSTGHEQDDPRTLGRLHLTVLAEPLGPGPLAALTHVLSESGANIDRIRRLARYPVTALELEISSASATALRTRLSEVAAANGIDIAIQPIGLSRRAKRLVVMDVDSTLLQDEVIDVVAQLAGCGPQVARITSQAMAGELDFADSLRQRVALFAGQDARILDQARERIRLTPGARTLIRTLRRLDHAVGIVSGGFTHITDWLVTELDLDFAAANTLDVVDGRLTGTVVGPVIDRAGKAAEFRRFAATAGVPLVQTVAIGDGANDVDMLAAAGLGVAFNAKPLVRKSADAAVNVPFLDTVLFLLGISRADIESVDAPTTPPADPPTG